MMENGELQPVRFTQSAMFNLIPKELWRQVAETDDTLILENVYRFGPAMLATPFTFFYGILDDDKVVGFFWSNIDVFTNRLNIYYMSIEKKYQQNGIVPKFKELAKFICDTYNLSAIYQVYSLHPKIAKRYGGKESSCHIMEFNCEDIKQQVSESSNANDDDKFDKEE